MVRMELSGEAARIDYAVAPEAMREPICRRGTNRDDSNLDDASGRILPTVKAFSVQCSSCLKWRLIPTKEMYEEIRQVVTENPFFCSRASTWRPHASCNDPSDLSQDTSLLWAIDKPDIPLAPAGWERLLVFRGEGSSKFADVYYRSPTGRRLRSMPDVERFLAEHPEYVNAGVSKSQFSFVKPKPLDPSYVKKRNSDAPHFMRGSITHKKPCTNKE